MSQDDSSYKQSSFFNSEDGAEQEKLKRCSTCHEHKPLTGFSKNRAQRDGYQNRCKACEAVYREANAEKRRAHSTAYRAANPDYMREWRAAHAEHIRASKRAYNAANAERIRAKRQIYNAANAERIRAKRQVYYSANKEKLLAYLDAYRAANKDALRAYNRAYQRAHPEMRRVSKLRRRVHMKGNGGEGFNRRQLWHLKRTQGGFCAYCCYYYPSLSVDHIIPIDQDGPHEAANIVLACLRCNSEKNAQTPYQWVNRWYYHLQLKIDDGEWCLLLRYDYDRL